MSLHEKAIEDVCERALDKLRPDTRVRVLQRMLKRAREEARKPQDADPRQGTIDVVELTGFSFIDEEKLVDPNCCTHRVPGPDTENE